MTFCTEVRQQTDAYWQASFEHPFVKGIVEGTLPLENFKYYMLQDAYYLKHYTKVLALAAAKAEHDEDIQYFLRTAQMIHDAELELHRTTFATLGVTEEEIAQFQPAPAAYNYICHMYQTVHNEDVPAAFAAILPCPWLYVEIGQLYKAYKPSEPLYAQWLALYSSDDFLHILDGQKNMMDRFATQHPKRDELAHHFMKSCYYEWHFWEMSWTLQKWTEGVYPYELTSHL